MRFVLRFLLTGFLSVSFLNTFAQSLYSKAFGNKNHPAVIFIHGGPSGNAIMFEATAAQQLADKGLYVILYDRRGEGRSPDPNAKITYQEAFDDLNGIYNQYGLKKASLIGFSFGGLVATQFAAKHPEKINALILTSALISQQETYDHILDSVTKIYTEKGDYERLKKVAEINAMYKNTAEYRKACFDQGSENGFFKVEEPTEEARKRWTAYYASNFYKNDIRNKNAPALFYQNEPRKNIDVVPELKSLKQKKVKIYALYGKQDAIFSAKQIDKLKTLLGRDNLKYVDKASHYFFVDQQEVFLDNVARRLKVK